MKNLIDYKKLITSICQKDKLITSVLLFGSYATGEFNQHSDIDIAILTESTFDMKSLGLLLIKLEDTLSKKVDLIVCNELYKNNAKLSFNISSSHTLLFTKDDVNYNNFKHMSYKYYLDIKPMLDDFDARFKRRILNGNFGKTKIA